MALGSVAEEDGAPGKRVSELADEFVAEFAAARTEREVEGSPEVTR